MLTRLESCITSTLPPGEEGSNRSELESPQRIATLGQLQWSPEGGLSFELPNVLPNGAQEEASFIVALFRITTSEFHTHLNKEFSLEKIEGKLQSLENANFICNNTKSAITRVVQKSWDEAL